AVRLAGHVDRELAASADSDGAGDLTRRTLAEADLGGDDDDVVTGRDRTTGAGGRGHRGGAHAARIAVARRAAPVEHGALFTAEVRPQQRGLRQRADVVEALTGELGDPVHLVRQRHLDVGGRPVVGRVLDLRTAPQAELAEGRKVGVGLRVDERGLVGDRADARVRPRGDAPELARRALTATTR